MWQKIYTYLGEGFLQKITGHCLQRDSVKGQHLFFLEFGGRWRKDEAGEWFSRFESVLYTFFHASTQLVWWQKGIRPVENPCYLLPVVRPEQVAEETGGTDQPRFTGKMALKTAVGVMMVRSSCWWCVTVTARPSVDVPDVHGVRLLSDFGRRRAAVWTSVFTQVSSTYGVIITAVILQVGEWIGKT